MSHSTRLLGLKALLIIAVSFLIYSPAFRGEWLWDDNVLITANPLMGDPHGLWKIWFRPGIFVDYYPLTFTVQRLQWNLWGMDPVGYHLTNVVLHVTSALLVWRLLSKLGLRLAWWGGLLFAIHPLQVESVAWIAELKNTLSMPPILLAMIAWIDFDERGKWRDYFLALGFFLIALLCKISVIMFPFVVLLYAWWKRAGLQIQDLKVAAPFFGLSLVLGLITTMSGIWSTTFDQLNRNVVVECTGVGRLVLVGLEIGFYFWKAICPISLQTVYPKWTIDPASPIEYLPLIAVVGVLTWFWMRRRTWGRHALFGFGFFLINLLPCPGFIPAGNMGYSWVMDHFVYLSLLGLIGLAVAAVGQLHERLSGFARALVIGSTSAITILLAVESHFYAGLYRDSQTLWTYNLQRYPQSWMVRGNLGEAFWQKGRLSEAIEQFEAVIKLSPDYVNGHYDLGNALSQAGRYEDAISQFQEVIKLNPNFANVNFAYGNALERLHRTTEAASHYKTALQINPRLSDAYAGLGTLLIEANHYPEAIREFQAALQIDGNRAQFHAGLAHALLVSNRFPEAINEYGRALQLDPSDSESRSNLGVALARTGHIPEAFSQVQAALQVDPNNAGAHNNLGSLFLVTGQLLKAAEEYQAALRIQPDFAEAQRNLARVQELQKQPAAAKPKP